MEQLHGCVFGVVVGEREEIFISKKTYRKKVDPSILCSTPKPATVENPLFQRLH